MNDQQFTAYELGVRITQAIALTDSHNWIGESPTKSALLRVLTLCQSALEQFAKAHDIPSQALEAMRNSVYAALSIAQRLPIGIDDDTFYMRLHCHEALVPIENLVSSFINSPPGTRNDIEQWHRLGREIPNGEHNEPRDCDATWAPDNPQELSSLLEDLGLTIGEIFPESNQGEANETIPDLPFAVAQWYRIENGMTELRRDGVARQRDCDEPTEARNSFIYNEACAGVPYSQIRLQVNRNTEWEHFESDQGVRQAARRYAERRELPMPPSRQRGRRRNE